MPSDNATEPKPPAESRRVSANELSAFCVACLTILGVNPTDAQITADVLVTTDTWGVHTHGIKALAGYVRRLRAGGLVANARPGVVSEGPAWAMVDGGSALGMVTSEFAMRTAIQKARVSGIGYVGVRNSCHFGAAGYYAQLAAQADMVGVAMANDIPSVSAPGSRGAITGSNPLAYAVPRASGGPILLDMATSIVAGGKVAAAHALGQSIPAGWVLDREGQPSTNPAAFIEGGSLYPMAGHKGYGIALLIETLSGLLTGAGIRWEMLAWLVHDPARSTNHGAAFLAFNVAAFTPIEDFKRRVDVMVADIHAAPKAPGQDRIYVPGEIEWERRQRALVDGILLPPDVVRSVSILADEMGLQLPGKPE